MKSITAGLKVKALALVAALSICGTAVAASPASGSCMSKAVSLKAFQAATLVNEYDPDSGEFWDYGALYCKVKLYKGRSYTIYIAGGNTVDMDLSVDTDWEDESAPWAMFDYASYENDTIKAAYLYADAWDEEDPASGTYYVYLSGEIGSQCNLYYTEGIEPFTPEGADSNPVRLNCTETAQSTGIRTYVDSDEQSETGYSFVMYMEQGRQYTFKTRKGSVAEPNDISFDVELPDPVADVTFTNSPGNVKYYVYPEASRDYVFKVLCPSNSLTTTKQFDLSYQVAPSRSPKKHRGLNADWAPYELNAGNDYALDVVPGRLIATKEYYDAVIDESLLRISLKAGERWVFDTLGATNMMMRVYDSAGAVLSENSYSGNGNSECRTYVEATADDWYYVGLCDPSLNYYDPQPVSPWVTIKARNVTSEWQPEERDVFDPADDVYSGATLLTAVPGSNLLENVEAQIDGSHVLSSADWYDWFVIPCVSGLTYQVQAFFDTDKSTDLNLGCKGNCRINGVMMKYSDFTGSLSPLAGEPLTFTPRAGGMYYFRVRVEEGLALDYPSYTMRVVCTAEDGGSLGRLRVDTRGLSANWYVTRDTGAKFDDGSVVTLPVGPDYKIKFANPEPENFKTPDPVVTNLVAWAGPDDIVRVVGVFTDVFDPADDFLDEPTGHATITPTADPAVAKRTLWEKDLNDWFKIKAEPGIYYNFELIDTTSEVVGDACFTLFSSVDGAIPVATNDVSFKKRTLPVPAGVSKQIYRLGVHHGEKPEIGSSYELHYSSANVGVIAFDQEEYVTKDTTTYKTLVVTRSASEGAVRVNYATVAGPEGTDVKPAKPGVNYYPAEGVLSWADGDMSPKEIRIRLIPDVEPKWEEPRFFSVRLWPMAEDCLEDDEYQASFAPGGDVASVKIKETAEMQPGSVEIVDTPLSYTLTDDLDTTIRIARLGGADGKIQVNAKTLDKDAVAGIDFTGFNLTHTWNEGDTNDWVVPLHLNEPSGEAASKQFIVKLSAVTPDDTFVEPEIPVVKTYFNIRNGKRGRSVEELNAEMRKYGVELVAATEKWHADVAGDLVSVDLSTADASKAQFRVEGPGFFICRPDVIDGVGKFIGTLRAENDSKVTEFKVNNGVLNTIAVPEWARTVSFKFKCLTGPAHADFAPIHDGLPFKWIPLSEFTVANPQNKSVVESVDELVWNAPAVFERADDIWCRVFIGCRGSKVEKITNVATNFTQETSCLAPAELTGKGSNCWWRIECAHMADPEAEAETATWLQVPNVWKFSVATDKTPRTDIGTDKGTPWLDVNGDAIVAGSVIQLAEGVYQKFTLAAAAGGASSLSLVDGELPPGMAITKPQYCKIEGTPRAAGDYSALLQVSCGTAAGTTLKVDFHVAEMGTAAGNFNGTLLEVGSQLTNAYPRVGRIYNVIVDKDGTIEAQVKLAGRKWRFATSGFDRVVDRDDRAPGQKMTYEVSMENVEYLNSVAYTNVLKLAIGSGESTNVTAYGEVAGTAYLMLNLSSEDGAAVQEEIVYAAQLMRSGEAVSEYGAAVESFAGYYTAALVPFGVSPDRGVPCGNGYATLTVADTGAVAAAGRLADGTAFSCSCMAQVVGNLSDPASCVLEIPLCAYASPWSFGGVLRICDGKVDSTATLVWTKDGVNSSYDRKGFVIEIHPTGGWYNTTANLQAYYLDRDFFAETESVAGIPEGMLPAGNDYTADTMPHDVAMILEGNTAAVEARKFVRSASNPELYDLAASVNPWDTKISFTRATGLVTGTFQAWSDGATQREFATLNHYGVLLMERDEFSPLDTDVWTAGFYLMPVTSKWTFSLPFNIRAVKVDRDWSEKVVPDVGEMD